VDLNWSASDNIGISYYVLKEGSYEIYRGSNTTKELEGLVSGNNYTLTVYAYDAAGNSNTSSVSFTTLGSSTSTTTTSTTTTSTTTTSTTTTTVPPSYGTPTIYKVTVSGSTITAFYNDATTNTGLSICWSWLSILNSKMADLLEVRAHQVTVALVLWTFQQNTQLFQLK
jgi:hypothetical protein